MSSDQPLEPCVLRTPRLRLLPLSPEHLALEAELVADPRVMRFLDASLADPQALLRSHLAREAYVRGHRLGLWAGHLRGSGEPVGLWMLEPPTRPDQVAPAYGPADAQAELGYRLLPRFWRQGLAAEGARELLRYGFEVAGLSRVFAETMAVNTASRAVMTSVGLEHVRTFHQDWPDQLPGAEHGEVEYEVTRDQWFRSYEGDWADADVRDDER